MIPILVLVFYSGMPYSYIISSIVFGLACCTDWLDGYLARKLQQSTKLGEFLDPVADKLMICTSLLLLVELYKSWFISIPAILIICREVFISALREWMAKLGQANKVKVAYIGKVKTLVQMFAIGFLLSNIKIFLSLGYILLYAALILTIQSMYIYCYNTKIFK